MTRPASLAARARAGWGAFLVSAFARATLLVLTGLLLWSVAPVAAGWSSTVVMSDSMAPRVFTGDVVLVRPIDREDLRTGQILLVDDPHRPERLLLHRLTAIDPDTGVLTLKGDANSRADSTPAHPDAVRGVAALRVPWIGSLMVWLGGGHIRLLAATAAVLTALVAGLLCYRPLPTSDAVAQPPAPEPTRALPTRGGLTTRQRAGSVPASREPGPSGGRTDTRPLPRVPVLGDLAAGPTSR